ncbi:hypothetical protein BASA61_009178 [Batrachochytrium salamandrivorans]|nr:hypothetical protein BASA62_004556 [Batrachochytrium salamandrivorans]KAH6581220.1 hypothetical protein BASA61_009178 [Batrachochytrium salamandrivorans]KAH9267747.1 hypothetical protein BASA84_000529 [Batrachochytrium salamandrivorans]
MKFGKYIVENSVPEWRTQYINYGKLKKSIKRARAARDSAIEGSHPRRIHHSVSNQNQDDTDRYILLDEGDQYLQLLDVDYEEDKDFFAELIKQLRKASRFFQERETEAVSKLALLREQCTILAQLNPIGTMNESNVSTSRLPQIFTVSRIFNRTLRRKLESDSNISESAPMAETSSGQNTDDSEEDYLAKPDGVVSTTANPRQRLIKAIKEYYRLLELINNYRILNEIAVQKILKKFTKGTGVNVDRFEAQARQIHLVTSVLINTLIVETEHLYAVSFENGMGSSSDIMAARRQAKKVLRVPDKLMTMYPRHTMSTWRSGLMTGLALPAFLLIIRKIVMTPRLDEFEFLLQIYGGLSVPIIFMYLFALCLQIWDHFHINWVLIFELDPRDYMPAHMFFEVASLLLLLFSYNMYFAIVDNIFGLHPYFYAPIMVGIVLAILVLPLPILQSQSQQWLWKSLFRIVFSGLFEVQFRDFFLCDLMISMTYSFISFQGIFCIISRTNDPASCASQGSLGASLATALPATWRLLQCFRRYRDNPVVHPHLSNALKYVVSLTVIILSTVSKSSNSFTVYVLWIIASGCATIFSYSWDVIFDWGLFSTNKNHRYLRAFIIYPKWVYFTAIGVNAVLRLCWVMLLAPSYWSIFTDFRFVVYIAALFEVFRRFGWAIIRLENEHSNNVGKFRAVKELPLPFRINMEVPLVQVTSR